MNASPLLEVAGLTVTYSGGAPVVADVGFTLAPGRILGLVGESGSGKTTVALSLLGHAAPGACVTGSVRLDGREVLALPAAALRSLRGRRIAYVPQNPSTALNPARRIGALLVEHLRVHDAVRDAAVARARAAAALADVGLDPPARFLARYPYQLSGGQQQRVVLALAMLCDPAVVVLDEPTTGLDVTTQRTVLDLLSERRVRRGTAMVYVTHDLGVLAEIATDLCVLYAGRVLETGPAAAVFAKPSHPYTRGLLASRPRLGAPEAGGPALRGLLRRDTLPPGCPFAPRCGHATDGCFATPQQLEPVGGGQSVACFRWRSATVPELRAKAPQRRPAQRSPVLVVENLAAAYPTSGALSLLRAPPAPVLRGISLALAPGEVLAVVGESGSGKSTLVRVIAGLVPASGGRIVLAGRPLAASVEARGQEDRRRVQLVFQNPDASLNPRRRVGQILGDAVWAFGRPDRAALAARLARALAEVHLPEGYLDRFPDQLSGGERQRVAIARALVVGPEILICDEVLSALDVSVQAGILELLRGICRERNMAILFISHDLAVVRGLAHRTLVLYRGLALACGATDAMLAPPLHPYVHSLLAAQPGEVLVPPLPAPSPSPPGDLRGCPFEPRCPRRYSVCAHVVPPWKNVGGESYRCHNLPLT